MKKELLKSILELLFQLLMLFGTILIFVQLIKSLF